MCLLTGEVPKGIILCQAFVFIELRGGIFIRKKRFYNYDVYEDGRVYSYYINRFLIGDNVQGYTQYTMWINKKRKRYKAHRLVAMLFIPNPNNYPVVNHIDGDKSNNNVENLEWCTQYHNNKHARDTGLNNIPKSNSERWKDADFRARTSKHISEGLLKCGANKGENNPRFKYRIYIGGEVVTRQNLSDILDISQSWTDTCIKRAVDGRIPKIFIDNNITVINTKEGQQTNEMSVTKH